MAHKYTTGSYLVLTFDRYGTKTGTYPAGSWTAAVALGLELAGVGGSYVVVRTVYNSLDGHPTAVRDLEEGENNE